MITEDYGRFIEPVLRAAHVKKFISKMNEKIFCNQQFCLNLDNFAGSEKFPGQYLYSSPLQIKITTASDQGASCDRRYSYETVGDMNVNVVLGIQSTAALFSVYFKRKWKHC